MQGRNVGDLLNLKGVTWGWFEGGFTATAAPAVASDGTTTTPAQCAQSHLQHQYGTPVVLKVPNPTIGPGADIHVATADYSPHHQPFQYYPSTRNQHHIPPKNVAEIGHNGQANHQYDITDFYKALAAHNLPAVTYLKAAKYQDAHPGNSDPLLEQVFLVQVINALQQSEEWKSTAVFIQYDDSDGWYDHVNGPIVNPSANRAASMTTTRTRMTRHSHDSVVNFHGSCQLGGHPDFGNLRIPVHRWHRPRGPMRLRSAPAVPGHLALGQAELRRSHPDRPDSSLRFIEDNWGLERIDELTPAPGAGSFDRVAGSVMSMFDFDGNPENKKPLILDPLTGAPAKRW